METTVKYRDLDFNFEMNPITHDVNRKTNENAIKQSIKNLVLMHNFESPFHPEIGSQVHSLLFDLNTPLTKETIRRTIAYTITNFEPRVNLIDIDVTNARQNENAVQVTIIFQIINTGVTSSYSFTIEKLR